jgi:Protein of unknown function (DUF3592)
VAGFTVLGFAGVGTGIADVVHAHQTGADGVPVAATVVVNKDPDDQDAVVVSYRTAAGAPEQGTVDTPVAGTSYPDGSVITVRYDPSDPAIVTLPGSGPLGPWLTVGAGVASLAIAWVPLARGRRRERHRQRAQAEPG